MNKTRSSTKIAIGFVALVAILFFGWGKVSNMILGNVEYPPAIPGNVNVIGIDPGAGYKIIVANQVAQLTESSNNFGSNDSAEGGATEGATKLRIPISDMLGAIRGDTKAVGDFIMKMNGIRQDDNWPSQPELVTWKAEDLQKAFEGDKVLRKKLESQLNVTLEGRPLPTVSVAAISNGILVDYPVRLTVNQNGKSVEVVGRCLEPYKPRFIRDVEESYKDKANLTHEMIATYYTNAAQELLSHPSKCENVLNALKIYISPQHAKDKSLGPERVLKSATVVINESHIIDASYKKLQSNDGKWFFNLDLELNDEGRRRLWQYSKKRPGTQILFTESGIAIAAPRIQHELAQSSLTITQLHDEGLVQEAIDAIKKRGK